MKTKFTITITILMLGFYPSIAQEFSIGLESGINFSNINKTLDHNRYKGQPGPIIGLFVKQNLGNWFAVQSGVNHSTFYYSEMREFQNYGYPDKLSSSSYYPSSSISSCYWPPQSYYYNDSKFSFLRIPLLLKYKTPGKVNVEFGLGAYYAFVTNDEYRGKDLDYYTDEYREDNFPSLNDWGWIMSGAVNYNISNKLHVFINAQITSGREEYIKNVEGKMGSTELTFGIGYRPFLSDENVQGSDSLGERIRIVPHVGVILSQAKNSWKDGAKYKPSIGFSSGISLNFDVGMFSSLKTGVWYERKGYRLDYDGNNPMIYREISPFNENYTSQIQSTVNLDYVTFPMQIEFWLGKKKNSNFSIGTYLSLLQNAFSQGEKIETSMNDQGFNTSKNFFNESFDESFKKIDVGFLFGYRLDVVDFTWGKFFISANQAFGVINILKNNEEHQSSSYHSSYDKIRNNASSIIFGLNIPVKQN